MKLLIITQKADINDDNFGFFHRWLEKFSSRLDLINVVCLWQGKYFLPPNVKIWSLGKEIGESRIKYIVRFYKYIWKLRKDYDGVFVHMNPIYAVLGGIFWRIWSKPIFLWHNHHCGNWITRLGIGMADTVFHTSKFAFASKFKKSRIMPAGIDIEVFRKDEKTAKIQKSILFLGRISPIKGADILIEAAKLLDREGNDFVLNIVGEAETKAYFQKVKDLSKKLETKGKIRFLGKLPNYKTPAIYNQNEVFINLSPPGLFDKTILEAMACETLVIVSSKAFQEVLPDFLIFKENDAEDLKSKISSAFNMSQEKKEELGGKLRSYVVQNHNLDDLIDKIISITKEAKC